MSNEPSRSSDLHENLRQRARILEEIRAFFRSRGVLEVETPSLGRGGISDATLSPFATWLDPAPGGRQRLFLQTSPEVFMKRLLAADSGPIFQICKSFRNGEIGSHHNPEFTMLEWYRPGWSRDQLMEEVEDLFHHVLPDRPRIQRVRYQDLFREHLDLDPRRITGVALQAKAEELGIDVPRSLSGGEIGAWLDLLMAEVIEPALAPGPPVFVTHYPVGRAALAAPSEEDPNLEDRFELLDQGLEIANGFRELTDPEEQRSRFESINEARRSQGAQALPMDERFLECLPSMPAASGVALGVDRLLMLATGATSLDEVLAFPFSRL